MLAFGRDLLSPLLNLGWFVGCLFAAWCIGRPYRVAPCVAGSGAIALSVPALSDQAGEARNDIVGIFFLLAAVAVAVNAWAARSDERHRQLPTGALAVVGLAAGLGRRDQAQLPAARCGAGDRPGCDRAARGDGGARLLAAGLAALAGGGYWYLRNLVHTGNPLPWVHHLGPISLPSPGQGSGRPRSAQRPRLPDRRLGLVGLVPARPPSRALALLAAARGAGARRPPALPPSRLRPVAASCRAPPGWRWLSPG